MAKPWEAPPFPDRVPRPCAHTAQVALQWTVNNLMQRGDMLHIVSVEEPSSGPYPAEVRQRVTRVIHTRSSSKALRETRAAVVDLHKMLA